LQPSDALIHRRIGAAGRLFIVRPALPADDFKLWPERVRVEQCNSYKYQSGGRTVASSDYENAIKATVNAVGSSGILRQGLPPGAGGK
jgi:hypothetical protein